MTVTTDIATATGMHRRLFIKIDGLADTLWQRGLQDLPTWAGRTHRACLGVRSEFTSDVDLGKMQAGMSAMEFELDDIEVSDVSYFGQLFAPARWSDQDYDHARVLAGTAPEEYIDADSATIPLVDSTVLGIDASAGTGYMGQETISWTDNEHATDTLKGVTKGLYPCVGSGQYGYTYLRPQLASKGASMAVGEVPFAWIGRRVALYIHTYDDTVPDWQPEAQSVLLWVGRISDEIRQSGDTGRWVLSCVSILDDLDVKIGTDFPESKLDKINLQGNYGRKFRVAYTDNVPSFVYNDIEITAGVYTIEELVYEMNTQLGSVPPADLEISVSSHPDKKSGLHLMSKPAVGTTMVYIHSYDGYFCHAWAALGFPEDSNGLIYSGSVNDTAYTEKKASYFDAYHPLSQDCNGGYLYVRSEENFWADQGDNIATRAFFKVEDAILDVHRKKEGTYFGGYSSLDAANSKLDLAEYVDGYYSRSAYVAHQADELSSSTLVKQVYIPQWQLSTTKATRGPYELLLYSLLSSGTPTYNGTYDDLPLSLCVAMQEDLVDTDSFLAASKAVVNSPLAHRTAYVIDEPISWNELAQREGLLFGYVPVWRRGKITVVNVLNPDIAGWDLTLDESNNLENPTEPEWPAMKTSTDTVVNQYVCKMMYDNSTAKYGPEITIRDPDSRAGLAMTKSITIEHPGVYRGVKSTSLKKLLPAELIGRGLRFPAPIVSRSLAPTLLNKIYTGDVVKFISNRVMDPDGSGLMATNALALVMSMRWNHALDPDSDDIRPAGSCVLMLLSQWASFGDPWAPSALVDKSAANGGLVVATNRLTLTALQWGATGETDDGAAFEVGDEVFVKERAPSDPTAPQSFGPWAVASAYETDGPNILTLDDDGVWAGWDATKEYVVLFADYGSATTDQKTRGIWQADDGTMKLSGGANAQGYG